MSLSRMICIYLCKSQRPATACIYRLPSTLVFAHSKNPPAALQRAQIPIPLSDARSALYASSVPDTQVSDAVPVSAARTRLPGLLDGDVDIACPKICDPCSPPAESLATAPLDRLAPCEAIATASSLPPLPLRQPTPARTTDTATHPQPAPTRSASLFHCPSRALALVPMRYAPGVSSALNCPSSAPRSATPPPDSPSSGQPYIMMHDIKYSSDSDLRPQIADSDVWMRTQEDRPRRPAALHVLTCRRHLALVRLKLEYPPGALERA
ncbi:hypothetical protein DENSPDRAFT_885755 [Dentipellis sp. KUC8613]|nr:hypothetical protein DENSPDRAFT_885755 [Dentipellis sp. KUC8613]